MIPENWEIKKFRDIGECIIGLTYKPSDVNHDGILVLRASNIQEGQLIYEDNVFVDMQIPKNLILRKNDILICVRNGSRDLIGKCALITRNDERMTFGAFMSVFRTRNAHYVFHQFQSHQIQKQIQKNLGATINQITNKNLYSFEILLPKNESEQHAIAEVLSDVGALITALDRLITKKRAIKQGALQQLLTGKTRLPGFSENWEMKAFVEMFDFLQTANSPRKDLSDNGSIKYIHYGDIHSKWKSHLDCANDIFPLIDESKVHNIPFLEDGDLVLADASEDYEGLGKSMEVKNATGKKIVAGLHTFLLRGNNKLLADGFKGYMQFIPPLKTSLRELATGISVYGISKNNLKSIQVLIPYLDEQRAIAAVLSDLDSEITAIEQERDKARFIRQGMMQELLSGRIRLL